MQSSPTVLPSWGTGFQFSSKISISRPGSGRPAFAALWNCSSSESRICERLATLREIVPSGFVSVMPQPCTISTPSVSQYQRISDTGGADPPQVTRVRFFSSQRPGSASIAAFVTP